MVEVPDLQALADFLPALQDPHFEAGALISPPKDKDGVLQMPYVCYSAVTEQLVETAYSRGWVLSNFDWLAWASTDEAVRLRDDETFLAQANPQHLMRLLTVCIRQERFAEGALLEAFKSGLILRIVQRAAVLSGTMR